MGVSDALLDEVASVVGARFVARPADDGRPVSDWWPLSLKGHGRHAPGLPWDAVVRPGSTEELSAVIRRTHAARMSVTPVGGRSGVVGSVIPTQPGIGIDLGRLAEIEINTTDHTARVGAGVRAGALDAVLHRRGFTTGLYPQSLEIASIGGLVATRGTGTYSGRYGGIEELLLGLTVVLGDGQVIITHALPRWSVGPDVRSLFLGSEGTLGMITEVTLRIFRCPERRKMRAFGFPDLGLGLRAARTIVQRGLRPAVLRLYDPDETQLNWPEHGDAGRCILITVVDGAALVAEAEAQELAHCCAASGGTDLGPDLARRWDERRLETPAGFRDLQTSGVLTDFIDIQAPWATLRATYEAARAALRLHCTTVGAHFSHVYEQGSSCYFVVRITKDTDDAALAAYHCAWEDTMDAVLKTGGGIAHHHGIGLARMQWARLALGSSWKLVERVKWALDPDDSLNPGKFDLSAGARGHEGP